MFELARRCTHQLPYAPLYKACIPRSCDPPRKYSTVTLAIADVYVIPYVIALD